MTEYPYSPELSKPFFIGDVDFLDPEVQKTTKKIAEFFHMEASGVQPLPGLRKSEGSYNSYDGTSISYLCAEPEETVGDLPAVVYFHGGGFLYPIQATMVNFAQLYAKNCGVRVFVPEYRLAPEHSCQTLMEDCYAMLQYVYDNAATLHVDRNRIMIYGDSAGGALAAAVTHMAKDRNGPKIEGLMLVYPVMDDNSDQYESVRQYPNAAWTAYSNKKMWEVYLFHGDCGMRKYAVPMAYDDLLNMPPAYIEPQEIDVLRDEALAYAEKLKAAGNDVEINLIPKSYHGFDADQSSPLVQRVMEKRYQVIRSMLQIM